MNRSTNNIGVLIKNKYKKVEMMVSNVPDNYMYGICLMSLIILYFFTYFQFNFGASVFFAIVTLLSLAKLNNLVAIIFGIIYAYCMYQLFQNKNKVTGNVIKDTDMVKNGSPFIGSLNTAVVTSSDIPQNSESGDFTYTFWMYVNSVPIITDSKNQYYNDYKNTWNNYRYGDWKSVFYRGNDMSTSVTESGKDVTTLQQFPGVWLSPKLNNLNFVFQNGESNQNAEGIEIENIPMNEWFHVTICFEGYSVSVYINGKLENTIVLNQYIPSSNDMNSKNIYICNDSFLNFVPSSSDGYQCPDGCVNGISSGSSTGKLSGFPGFLGEMVYFPYVLTNNQIMDNYNNYKEIIDSYQENVINSIPVDTPPLITSSNILTNAISPNLSI